MHPNMNRKPIKVLVADDEPAMRRGIRTSLNVNGYEVEEVRSGEEAVAAARERPPISRFSTSTCQGWAGSKPAGASAPPRAVLES